MIDRQAQTGADRLAARLAAAGMSEAFGIPGGEVLALVDAFARHGITPRLAKHENAAGFMAEGVWHATGMPGLLFATLGPGVANAVNVVANAHQDRVPLLFITGCVDAAEAETYTHQVFDHQALLRPIVKASFRATAASADRVIDQALAIALSGRPGPVHIDVPIGVAEGPAVGGPMAVSTAPLPVGLAEGSDLDAMRAALRGARRPLILAGLDIVNQNAHGALARFAVATGAPLITTYKAKGVLPESHPGVLGAAGLSPKADAILLPLIRAADLVVLAGYDPIEMRLNWRQPFAEATSVLDLVAQAVPHGMHRADVRAIGDVGVMLDQLCGATASDHAWSQAMPARVKAQLDAAFAGPPGWGPHAVFRSLRAIAPAGSVITADSGAHRILLSQIWPCEAPHSMLQSSGLCTMGCAVPLALGYKLARPEVPVIAFVGDAGFEMGLGELASAREHHLPIVIVVLVDDSLGLIEMKQRASGRANVAVDFSGSDFPGLARAMGGYGAWIDDAATLRREAAAALGRSTFSVLACRIGRRAYEDAF